MRSKIVLALIALLLTAMIAFGTHANSVSAAPVLQSGTCKDADFLKQVNTDFTDAGKVLTEIKDDDGPALVNGILTLAGLRQKYEEGLSVSNDCFVTQLSLIFVVSNVSDLLSIQLGKLADPKNAADYDKVATNQSARVTKLYEQFQSTLATPAK